MKRYWAMATLFVAPLACNDEAPGGTGMIIETVAEQPSAPAPGVSLAIHARGGRGVFVSIEQGKFLTLSTPGTEPALQQSACFMREAK